MPRFKIGQNVRLTKLRDADNITGYNTQPAGRVIEGLLVNTPVVGQRLAIRRANKISSSGPPFTGNGGYRTSTIQQVVDVNEFQLTTHNSVYKLEAL